MVSGDLMRDADGEERHGLITDSTDRCGVDDCHSHSPTG